MALGDKRGRGNPGGRGGCGQNVLYERRIIFFKREHLFLKF
jgi:ribosomal protein L15